MYKQLSTKNLIANNYWNESITKISLLLRGSVTVHHQNSPCNAEREGGGGGREMERERNDTHMKITTAWRF